MLNIRDLRASSRAFYFVIVVSVTVIFIEGWNAYKARAIQIKETYAAINNVSFALAQHANATVKEADLVLAGMVERIKHDGTSPAALERIHLLLESSVREIPSLDGIFVSDESGNWLATSLDDANRTVNTSDREYFIYHRDHPDAMPHLGPPVISRSSGKWIFTISRRISKSDGSFGGVVSATLDIGHFERFYEQFDIGEHGSILLGLMNGTAIYRRPLQAGSIGRDLSQTPIYRDNVLLRKEGVAIVNSSVDHIVRFNSFRRVQDYPLFVTAAMSGDDALADWVRDTVWRAAFIFVSLTMILFFGRNLIHQIREREVAEDITKKANLKLENLNHLLTELAMQDGLTGLSNRRYFDASLEKECARAKRENLPLSLLMIDVDFFKRYNDQYGHQEGDGCLQSVANAIQKCVKRPGDIAARYGGEEFCVILPNCGVAGAEHIAEKICEAVRSKNIQHELSHGGRVTLSIGITSAAPADEKQNAGLLIKKADQALYEAKRRGRDQYFIAE